VMLVVFLVSSAFKTAVCEPRHSPSLDDLLTLKDIEALSMSPDGAWLAYACDGSVSVIPVASQGHPRKIADKGMFPVWAPDSKHLAYYAGEPAQLWVLNIVSNREEQVTNLKAGVRPSEWTGMIGTRGSIDGAWHYSWSPDSTQIVFPSQAEQHGSDFDRNAAAEKGRDTQEWAPLILTANTPPDWTLSGIFRSGGFVPPHRESGKVIWNSQSSEHYSPAMTNQLFVVNVQTKTVRQLTRDNDVYFGPDWSPDGRKIACASSEGRPLVGWGSGPTNIYVIDVQTGNKSPVTTGDEYNRAPQWSPDGRTLAYLSWKKGNPQQLLAIPANGGEPTNVTRQLDRDIYLFSWAADGKSAAFIFFDGVSMPIGTADVRSSRVMRLIDGHPAARLLMATARTGVLAWTESDDRHRDVIYIRDSASSSARMLLDANPEIHDWKLGDQVLVYWKNGRGEDITGILIKPVGYQAGQRYPLIVDCYPGLPNSFKGTPMWGNQTWAARGYAVFWPVSRAPHVVDNPYKEPAFTEAARGSRGLEVMADDILSGVDELVREGIADPDRMALYGISNGGAVVNQMVIRTDRFKCAVSVAAAWSADWIMPFFLRTEPKLLPMTVGVYPWEQPEEYVALSTVFHLDRVRTPVLLIDGDNDGMFLLNTIEIYNGLRFLHKDVVLLRYPEQGHIFSGSALKDFSERVNTFIEEHLKPVTASRMHN